MHYLSFTQKAGNEQILARQTAAFLNENLSASKFLLIKHRPHPDAIQTIFPYGFSQTDISKWKQQFSTITLQSTSTDLITAGGWYYFFLKQDYSQQPGWFFAFPQKPDDGILHTLNLWNERVLFLQEILLSTRQNHETKSGNLVAQLLHDMQAIITLQAEDNPNTPIQQRLQYQQRVDRNLLFFVRPLELLVSKIPLYDFITASLDLLNISSDKFSLTLSPSVADIIADAEFMSRAVNEIVQNALESGANQCIINADITQSASPFLQNNWLELSFFDQGEAISADYLERVYEPFFTTRKNLGHSGFGLAIAKKIVEAHGGYIEISSEKNKGTLVKLLIPV